MSKNSIRKNSIIATIAILGSRLFGLVREQIFAFFFGASLAQDAFIAAFRIPNLLRDLFAEGALSQSFITVFSQTSTKDDKRAHKLANKVFTFLFLFLGILVVLGIIFSPQIVSVIANGFTGEKFELTVSLNRIMFPFILFVSFAALFMGMLNAKGKFFLPQSASTFFNITSITVGLLCAYFFAPEYIESIFWGLWHGQNPELTQSGAIKAIQGMAIGTLAGGMVQWLVQAPSLFRSGYRLKLDFQLNHPDLIRVLKLTGPAIIGSAAVQVNVMVNTFFASYLEDGAISYLNFAFRLMQFPLGVFGVAIALASTPTLARLISQKKHDKFRTTIRSSMQMSLFLSLPSTIGLIVLAAPIIQLIYEHGEFSQYDSLQTSYALMAYSLGIASYSLIKIYQPAFLAFDDAKTPMIISIFSIIINFTLNWIFVWVLQWQHWGLALATACVATINFILLALFFSKKLKTIWSSKQWVHFLKTLTSSLLMGLVVWFSWQFLQPYFLQPHLLGKAILVFVPVAVAVPVYFALAKIFRIDEAEALSNTILRKIRK